MRNIALAVRTLGRTPFVTSVAILSLALGIGSNTAIFSIFDELLRQPLPVHEPTRLVNLSAPGVMNGSTSCSQTGPCEWIWSYPMFKDLEREAGALSGIAAHSLFGVNLALEGRMPVNVQAVMVSGSYFPVLGVQPALGRLLGQSDDETVGSHFVAVLSHRFWERTLGADPSVIGKTVAINGQLMTVVGVGPRGFDGATVGAHPAVFVPITMRARLNPGVAAFENRQAYWVYLFGRLRDGTSMEEARAALNVTHTRILENVELPLQAGLDEPLRAQFRQKQVVVEDGSRGQSVVHRYAATPLVLLLGVTGIVLLIACANVANLILARGAARAPEMAVRLSLGASRAQLVTQLLTESLVLALAGGIVSLLLAYWTLRGMTALIPSALASTMDAGLSDISIAFALLSALGTGVVVGLFPALASTRSDLIGMLRGATGKHSGGRGAARFRTAMVTAQMTLSTALLMFAGLFIKSLANVSRVDLGLDVQHMITFTLSPGRNGYEAPRSQALFAQIESELAAQPAVTGVASGTIALLSGSWSANDVRLQGYSHRPGADANAAFSLIGPGYFKTFGVPVLAGREFTAQDIRGHAQVAIVNESFARKFGVGRDVIGKRMANGHGDNVALDIEIVGLVEDSKYSQVKDRIPPQFFLPHRQAENVGRMHFYAATSGDPAALLRSIPDFVRRIDAGLPVENLKTMPQQVADNTSLDRMISILSSAFALLATLLAAIGLYGVLAYSVSQRTQEIGVRMALGATGRSVATMVLRQMGSMTVVGGVIGLVVATGLGRLLKSSQASLLFELESHDAWVMTGTAVFLAIVALSAGMVPALRAARVAPMQALRHE